jgi:hypothetical protein
MMASNLPNFRLGIQVADGSGNTAEGEARYTSWAKDANLSSEWAADLDRFDPDAVRVGLDVESTNPLGDLDFRVGGQAFDQGDNSNVGPLQFTPWVSQGGGWTGLVSDKDGFDPDAFRIVVETRPLTTTRTLKDMRVGLQMFDAAGAEPGNTIVYTPWASQGGGWTEYAVDADAFDPDGLKIKLESRFE